VMTRARLAACEALSTFAFLESKRKQVQNLERSIRRSVRDLETAQEGIKLLENEALELSGKISALEKSEGMQLAQRLSEILVQAQKAQENLGRSQSALLAATERREQTEEDRDAQSQA
jgi:hypothetical protein